MDGRSSIFYMTLKALPPPVPRTTLKALSPLPAWRIALKALLPPNACRITLKALPPAWR